MSAVDFGVWAAVGSGVDIVAELFKPLPSMVVAHYLGVPEVDWDRFDEWTDAIVTANAAQDESIGAGADAEELDVTRRPRQILTFAHGAHHCLGAAAARMMGRATLTEILTRAAGCSRATLYRYFENRQALIYAFAHREARLITKQVARATTEVSDPRRRVVEAVLACLAAVPPPRRLVRR